MKYLIMLTLLTSCGKPKTEIDDPRTISGVDTSLAYYVDMYIQAKENSLNYDIPVGFGDMTTKGLTVGECVKWTGTSYRQIVIKKDYWDEASESEKINLIFHEFGHCDLDRNHDEIENNGKPESLMYPINYGFAPQDFDFYVNELFNRG